MEHLSAEDKEFIEQVDEEYYTRVKSSDDFYRRKRLILMNLDKLQAKVEKQAKNYDDYQKLRFIMLERAKQKKSIVKNFIRLENFRQKEQAAGDGKEERKEDTDDFDLLYGIENEQT